MTRILSRQIALLFCSALGNFGRMLSRYAIYDVYAHYEEKVFPHLLDDAGVPDDDKDRIRALLKKPRFFGSTCCGSTPVGPLEARMAGFAG